jgi:hypothetical protein
MSSSSVNKVDNTKSASEEVKTEVFQNGSRRYYNYFDNEIRVWKNNQDDKYYLTNLNKTDIRNTKAKFPNPFDFENAEDIEKIVDAVVGSLKDNVLIEELNDKSKVYSGSLSESQVPTVINAISSFGIKQLIQNNRRDPDYSMPNIQNDIYIKNISGKATENKEGLVESIEAKTVFSGVDKEGRVHDISILIYFSLLDVNTTAIEKPNLENEKVEKVNNNSRQFDRKHIGIYKNNIVIEENDKLVKIGERVLEIVSIDEKNLIGKYYEVYKTDNDYNTRIGNFDFMLDTSSDQGVFQYTLQSGEKQSGMLHLSDLGEAYLNLNVEVRDDKSIVSHENIKYFKSQFVRVFD